MSDIVKFIGLTGQVAGLIEQFRESPIEPEFEIIRRLALRATASKEGDVRSTSPSQLRAAVQGCNLGSGVVLAEGSKMYLFRYQKSLEARKPEGLAVARGGKLFIDEHEIKPSKKGSYVQPALQFVQKQLGDFSQKNGGLISLDAWGYWYVERNGCLMKVGDLRDQNAITRRGRRKINYSLEELGL